MRPRAWAGRKGRDAGWGLLPRGHRHPGEGVQGLSPSCPCGDTDTRGKGSGDGSQDSWESPGDMAASEPPTHCVWAAQPSRAGAEHGDTSASPTAPVPMAPSLWPRPHGPTAVAYGPICTVLVPMSPSLQLYPHSPILMYPPPQPPQPHDTSPHIPIPVMPVPSAPSPQLVQPHSPRHAGGYNPMCWLCWRLGPQGTPQPPSTPSPWAGQCHWALLQLTAPQSVGGV